MILHIDIFFCPAIDEHRFAVSCVENSNRSLWHHDRVTDLNPALSAGIFRSRVSRFSFSG